MPTASATCGAMIDWMSSSSEYAAPNSFILILKLIGRSNPRLTGPFHCMLPILSRCSNRIVIVVIVVIVAAIPATGRASKDNRQKPHFPMQRRKEEALRALCKS